VAQKDRDSARPAGWVAQARQMPCRISGCSAGRGPDRVTCWYTTSCLPHRAKFGQRDASGVHELSGPGTRTRIVARVRGLRVSAHFPDFRARRRSLIHSSVRESGLARGANLCSEDATACTDFSIGWDAWREPKRWPTPKYPVRRWRALARRLFAALFFSDRPR